MRRMRILRGALVILASFGMLIPQVAFGVGRADSGQTVVHSSKAILDIVLQDNGLLKGQVLDKQGASVAGVKIAVGQQGKVLAVTKTDATGHFRFEGLKGGVFQVATTSGGGVYRLWTPRTAPPSAQTNALVINGDTVVRGGANGGGLFSNPWFLGGIAAAAIAIPLALDSDDDKVDDAS